jgi:Zn-dependent protease with chaperone function
VFGFFRRRKADTDQGSNVVTRIFSIVLAVGAVMAFILTENMKNPMIFVNTWTLLMAGIAVLQGVVLYFSRRNV